MNNDNNNTFAFGSNPIIQENEPQEGQFPVITFTARVPGINNNGAFFVTQDEVNAKPEGWEEGEHLIGNEIVPVYYTRNINVPVIAYRASWIIQDDNKNMVMRKPRRSKVSDFKHKKMHVQALVEVAGLGYCILAMKGKARTLAFLNNRDGYQDYPIGPAEVLRLMGKKAGDTVGVENMSFFGLFRVNLGPKLNDDGRPVTVKVGRDNSTSLCYLLYTDANPDDWAKHYVGDDDYNRHRNFLDNYALEWSKEWNEDIIPGESSGNHDGSDSSDNASLPEDSIDSIPW